MPSFEECRSQSMASCECDCPRNLLLNFQDSPLHRQTKEFTGGKGIVFFQVCDSEIQSPWFISVLVSSFRLDFRIRAMKQFCLRVA